jgi:hypothetical protein
MKSILAENLLRFGAKGITKETLDKYLAEQTKVPANVYQTPAITTTLDDLTTVARTYNPQSGYIRISGGNPWLAQQRANSLSTFLDTNLIKKVNVRFNKEETIIEQVQVLGPEPENQRTVAKLYAKFERTIPKEDYKYQILYNFYEIGGKPYFLVTNQKIHTPGYDVTAERRATDVVKSIPGAIAVKQSTGGSLAGQQQQFTVGILVPITGFAERTESRLYFKDPKSYQVARDLLKKYTDISGFKETGATESGLIQSEFKSTRGGGGDYIIGKRGGTANVSDLTSGKQFQVTRGGESGQGADKGVSGTGKIEEADLGEISLDTSYFADNMITILPASYEKIFSQIQTNINKLLTQRFTPIEIRAVIQGFASNRNATNRAAAGVTPDHTWGNRLQINQWITQ